jgi:hypothetical protein
VTTPHPFVEFEVANEESYVRLEGVVHALTEAKRSNDFHDDAYWLEFFDTEARSHFWWPSDEQRQDWSRRWGATPVERRLSDPSLVTPWEFGSMIDALRDGEYELVGCRRIDHRTRRLELCPWSWPYGGTECIRALVEAFGHRVTREQPA